MYHESLNVVSFSILLHESHRSYPSRRGACFLRGWGSQNSKCSQLLFVPKQSFYPKFFVNKTVGYRIKGNDLHAQNRVQPVLTFTMTRTDLKVHCWGWIGLGGCVSLINKNQRPNKRQSRNRNHQNLVLMNKQELSCAMLSLINYHYQPYFVYFKLVYYYPR